MLASYKKKVDWFLSHVCNGKFAAFWVLICEITCKWVLFPTMDLQFYQFAQIVRKYIIDSFPRALSRLRQKLNIYVFQLAKNGTIVGLLRFSLSFLFECAAINRVNLSIIDDTHLTLAAIPFKVEANNSLIFLP